MGPVQVQETMQNSSAKLLSFAKLAHHNPWLDLLRTAAIVFVLLRHGSRIENNGLSDGVIANLFANGWVGVDLFFVLSGYLIAGGLIRRSGSQTGLFPKGYFKDRILRIVPAYYAVLFLCIAGFFPGFGQASAQSIFAHLLFLQDYTGANINVVFWSLGVEEKFYLIAPVIVLLLIRQSSLKACLGVCAVLLFISPLCRGLTFEAIGGAVAYDAYFAMMRSPFHMSMEGFVVGIMAAILRARGVAMAPTLALATLGLCAGVLAVWLGSHEFLDQITRIDVWLTPSLLALLFGLMVFCAACLANQKLRFEPFFRVNARLSYTLYLVHFPLLPLAAALSAALADQQHFLVFWASYLALSYALATALHFGVEKPFLLLKQSLNRPGRPVAAATQGETALS